MKSKFILISILTLSVHLFSHESTTSAASNFHSVKDTECNSNESLDWESFESLNEIDEMEEFSKEEELQAKNCVKKFFKHLKQCKNLDELDSLCEEYNNKLKKIFNSENKANQFSNKFIDENASTFKAVLEKFRDEGLKTNGLILQYPPGAYYFVFFETEKKYFSFSNFKWMRLIRFKVAEHPDGILNSLNKRVEAGNLVLLNEDKFEIAKITVDAVDRGKNTTGRIELTEDDYKTLHSVELHPLENSEIRK